MDIVLHQFSGDLYDGTYGRISVLKKYFNCIGGYDESFEPVGYEDKDLFLRLSAAGLLYIPASDCRYNNALYNSKQESMTNTGSSKGFMDMLIYNEGVSKKNIENGYFIANNGVWGIRKNIYDHLGNLYEIDNDSIFSLSHFVFPPNQIHICESDGTIPKIIHQVWGGQIEFFPEIYSQLAETWKIHYPEWDYELWNDKRMNIFIKDHYPQYLDMYKNFHYNIQRWEAIRYLILHKMGGMYIDFDYESIAPIDELVRGKTCCFAMEPESHCLIFSKPVMFNNAMMLSVPGHPFMQKVIETFFSESWQKSVTEAAAAFSDEYRRKNHIVLHSTGPWMLMELYNQLTEKEKSEIYLIPDKYVTPFDVNQAGLVVQGDDTEELNQCLSEAYAVHYFYGLWKNAEK